MAPIKFEENMKEKLEKRTLEPSSDAWDKLSEKLEVDTKKPFNRTILWLGIAASLVGILFMGNMLFTASETNTSKPVLGDTEINEVEILQKENDLNYDGTLVEIEEAIGKVENISDVKTKSNQAKNKSVSLKKHHFKNASLAKGLIDEKQEETLNNPIITSPSPETELAQANNQERTKNTVTDIDSLLKKAQQNLAKNTNNKNKTIDAQALLQDVEEDIEASFRDKVFETLITGYKKVKTAVVERND